MTEDFGTRREWLRYWVGWHTYRWLIVPMIRFGHWADRLGDRVIDWSERA